MKLEPPVLELSMDQLEAIVQHAKQLGLPQEEHAALLALMESYAYLVTEIGDRETTIERLRELLFGAKTESRKNVQRRLGKHPEQSSKPNEQGKRKGHGRKGAKAYTGARKVKTTHPSLKEGGPCPQPGCTGKLYAWMPERLVRFRGSAPFQATVYEQERLRCNLCQEIFTTPAPEGVGEKKFDETVPSGLAVLHYDSGLPLNRLEKLQQMLGMPLPASVQWELLRDAAKPAAPVYRELIRQAAQSSVLYNDDTPMKILAYLVDQRKRKERGEKPPERTGMFTSGIVAESPEGRRICLYFTGIKHAGENLKRVLEERAKDLDPPIQMCDGLDRNLPAEIKTILSNCLTHGRRRFVDVLTKFPEQVEHVVDELAIVYRNDRRAKTEGMTPAERLRLHQEESGPVMERLKAWMEALLKDKVVEPNSSLGKAIGYMVRRWEPLTLFLRVPGAPLDNSVTERMLKRSIIHRKNSLFYKTQNGADVGDLFMSLIGTAKMAGADPFDYLNQLQRHADEVWAAPSDWMPWNYRATIERVAATAG